LGKAEMDLIKLAGEGNDELGRGREEAIGRDAGGR
jgi:hypothetical protein